MHTVVLVDDEFYIRQGLKKMINWETYDFKISGEAEDGEQAWQMIQDTNPDVVITDICMPVMDGINLIKRIKESQVYPCKFIIISGYGEFKYAQQAVRFGVHDFLLKPIEQGELTQALERLSKILEQEKNTCLTHQQWLDLLQDVRHDASNDGELDTSWDTILLEQIEENRLEEAQQTITRMFREFQVQRLAPEAVRVSLWRSIQRVLNVIRSMDGDEQNMKTLSQLMRSLDCQVTLTELRRLFLVFVQEAVQVIDQLRQNKHRGEIEKIKRYIDLNYHQHISLKHIANKFYLNPIYLGQLFKKTYDVYFKEYLLQIRINEAKRLLRQSDLRVYEIAEKVGFKSVDYFVTKFEEREGMTPTAYRNRLLGRSKRVQTAK
ncbi:two-component system response regulator YesN [Caldalkalibacillus uzonensis]|uniref:Two-component system response regulator YesN n=1 Tax=Caldalkalibacillus uzonensis TaxID=353224 RepID=A0ABU0CSX5_9BACI|nr:response regulator [Caldalkalibacillus uzonensis]MDQ0338595.1 two-component system response regulator YesN [Caldalkalibacillus uzonensis]